MNALQIIETCEDEAEARALRTGFLIQCGCIGIRILPPECHVKSDKWRVQAFFEDDLSVSDAELEHVGMRRVMLIDSILQQIEKP